MFYKEQIDNKVIQDENVEINGNIQKQPLEVHYKKELHFYLKERL